MDLVIPITIFSGLVLIFLFYIVFKYQKKSTQPVADDVVAAVQPAARRAVGNRNRIRDGAAHIRPGNQNVENEPDEQEGVSPQIADIDDPKIGAKKRAKLEAKAEKKAQREAELKMREQRKKQQEKDDAERKLKEEKERLEEEKKEEEQKRLQEEKERQEEEEYRKMKEAFTVEEEGFDEEGEDEQGNLLQEFISHIKDQKVVMLEDLAAKFHLKAQTVRNRIDELQASGVLTGVIDDRGKFIYITMEELQAVADFVKKRGRVTIQELVENSNNLITLS